MCSVPALLLGVLAPGMFFTLKWIPAFFNALYACYLWMPKPLSLGSIPAVLLAGAGILISVRTCLRILGLNYRRGFTRLMWRFLPRRLRDAIYNSHVMRAIRNGWPQLVSASVFGLHAILPAISTYSAVSVIISSVVDSDAHGERDPNGWDLLPRISGVALGAYSLCAVISRHLQNEHLATDENSPVEQPYVLFTLRILGIIEAAARASCVLMAWAYASLMLDLWATQIAHWTGQLSPDVPDSALGVMGPLAWAAGAVPGTNPLYGQKAVSVILNVVSIISQQRLVQLLSRREVLLKLIGAERLTAQTLMLLLKGVAVACSSATSANPIAEFLMRVSPPPVCVALIVALRSQAVILGATLVLAPWLALSGLLGSIFSFAFGILAGAYATHAVLSVWYSNRADLESPALRLALLVPGAVSGRAKGLLRGALVGARTRAVQMMAVGLMQRIMRWWWRPIGG